MSYERKLTTFKKGNQLSNCEEYNLEDLNDMFSDTQFTNSELYLEDVLTISSNGKDDNHYGLSRSLVVTTECDDMFCYLNKDDDKLKELHAEIARLVELDNKITERVNAEFEAEILNERTAL